MQSEKPVLYSLLAGRKICACEVEDADHRCTAPLSADVHGVSSLNEARSGLGTGPPSSRAREIEGCGAPDGAVEL